VADRLSLEAWSALWRRLGARSDPRPLHLAIHRAYTEPHRRYHTIEHIARAVGLLDGVRDRLRLPDEAELAVWLHDVVYDPRAAHNEERSAAYARQILAEGGAAADRADRVAALIMATRHTPPPEEPDARYLVDADLAILGGTSFEFARYERQVRQEYFFRSEAEWRERRARLLRAFLDRPRIFLTPEFASFEAPARANLTRSLARLTADPPQLRSAP
jgi:predicted metal-dependent HD superfamily phosphohydrolase